MVKYYKSYKVFLSGTLMKLVIYLFYPVMILFWCGLIAIGMGVEKVHAMYALLITAGTILWAEIMLDNFIYGGILAKDTNKLEYLKTSHRGMSVLRKSLCVDKLRRLVTVTLLFTIIYSVCNEQVSVGQLISVIFVTSNFAELGLLVTRHFSSINVIIIIAMVASALGIVAGTLAVRISPIFAILFLLMFAAVCFTSNRVIMKKAERSFYDVKVE